MDFSLKKRLISLFIIVLIVCSFNASADSDLAGWTRAYCLYNAGSGGYACDSGQVTGDSATCSAANGAQCAEEGDVYCYSESSCENGTFTDGPVTAYNVNWDSDSADCSCSGKPTGADVWFSNLDTSTSSTYDWCCGDDGTSDDWATYSGSLTTSTSISCRRCLDGADKGTVTRCGNGYFGSSCGSSLNPTTATSGICYYGDIGCSSGSSSNGASATRYGNGNLSGSGNSRTCYYGDIGCSDGSSSDGASKTVYGWGWNDASPSITTDTSFCCRSGAATCVNNNDPAQSYSDSCTTLYGNGYVSGTTCYYGDPTCQSGSESNGSSCTLDANDICGDGTACFDCTTTGYIRQSTTQCYTSCTEGDDSNCASGYTCEGTSCVAKLGNGNSCNEASDCTSGNCIDGYCCNSACTAFCYACDVSGSVGTCTAIANGQDPDNECADSGWNGCSGTCTKTKTNNGFCNGAGACGTDSQNVAVGNVCSGGSEVNSSSTVNCDTTINCVTASCSASRYYRGCASGGTTCTDTNRQSYSAWAAPSDNAISETTYKVGTSCSYSIANENTDALCSDGIDNNCNGLTDCADHIDCDGKTGPGGSECCDAASDCIQDDCVIESCGGDLECDYTNRAAGATDECTTCYACDTAGGNCVGITANDGKNCVDDCTYCNAGSCTNRAAGATDECTTCYACDTAGGNCVGLNAETGKNCNTDCYDCVSGVCTAKTENNDGNCNDDCNSCVTGTCTNRNQCDSTECSADKYCDSAGGNCKTPDESSSVCLNCVADQTSDYSWTWTPPNHEDAGKAFGSDLFNSDAGPCTEASGGSCFDNTGTTVNHKSALTTGNCCGDDADEFYKPDYYGPECTNDVNECVWSTGDSQASDTGNAEWWCYLHEWYECKDSTIGTKVGGVTCAGVAGNTAWTPNSLVLSEDQYSCSDGIDNDGDDLTDCEDHSDCDGKIGPGGSQCCDTVSDCIQDDCVIESCGADLECDYTNRQQGATDECTTCHACDTAGGNCVGISAETGKNCNNDCYDCQAGSCVGTTEDNDGSCNNDCNSCVSGACTVRSVNDNTEVTITCYYCDGSNAASQPYSGNNGVNCNDDCNSCVAGTCTDRSLCDSTECSADKYCDSTGGDCKEADESSSVCLNCITDTTPSTTYNWIWDNPLTTEVDESNHEDAGIGYGSELFNSNNAACTEASGGSCFDNTGTTINHKSALTTGNCCGDDANEFYKPDYYGGECTNNVNDCVWSTGDAQVSDSGNVEWWCYLHEWDECTQAEHIGEHHGSATCAGAGTGWTINPLPENQYSCTDGFDGDGDGLTDCQDPDCNGNITGYVRDQDNELLEDAKVEVFKGSTWVKEGYSQQTPHGFYEINNIPCGTYNLVASKEDYISNTKTNIELPPVTTIQQNFTLTYGIVCEQDCSYLLDDRCHAECDGINGCNFYDITAREKCDLAKIGWDVEYSEDYFIECCNNTPQEIIKIKAVPGCPYENLVKHIRVVYYKGKLIRMITIICGD